ncbi:unnamed protein product [Paramecium primaurelia]|uniref:ceramidase n=1 Tax=Paramecium primaurelia TaxID=5886 RepID=A0A8S1QDU0_PARPR|nr:unnamed protein product [Paramecium primaurelia]
MVHFNPGSIYYFDLDLPVEQRYSSLFPKYALLIRKYCQIWLETNNPSQEHLNNLKQLFENHPDKEMLEFVKYFAKECGIDESIILYIQFMYDFGFDDSLSMGCTSILINQEKPYIVRNLDWDFNDVIRALTINAIYIKNKQIVSIHLAIVSQLLTPHTIKNQSFAISLNFLWPQYKVEQQWQSVLQNVNIPSIGRLIYRLSVSNYQYDDLKNVLKDILVQHHGLLNIIGNKKNQCAIFYINDWFNTKKYQFCQEIQNNEDYLVSTNGDYFQFSIERYTAAQQNLKKQKDFSNPIKIVENVAFQYPNYNETTILTTILDCQLKLPFDVYIK